MAKPAVPAQMPPTPAAPTRQRYQMACPKGQATKGRKASAPGF